MKKKICFIITKSEVGGAQKWLKEQSEILSDDFEIYLVSNQKGWLSENIQIKNSLLDNRIEKRISFVFLIRLIKFVIENKIDLIVASSANAGIYSRLLKVFVKIKTIYISHGWSAIYNGGKFAFIFKKIEYLLSFLSDSILCISQADYEKAKNQIGISKKKLELIENKIIPMRKKGDFRGKEIPKIVAVARLAPPKRLDLLIKAVKFISCELYIIGDGLSRKKLEDICHNYNIKNVFFEGEIKNFNEFYRYDIFALISDSEGLSMSAIEAMSVGLPLLLSDVGGCKELIKDNGILIKNEILEIENGILEIIEDKKEMSKKSLKLFNKKFNLELNKYEYINYYKSVLKVNNGISVSQDKLL